MVRAVIVALITLSLAPLFDRAAAQESSRQWRPQRSPNRYLPGASESTIAGAIKIEANPIASGVSQAASISESAAIAPSSAGSILFNDPNAVDDDDAEDSFDPRRYRPYADSYADWTLQLLPDGLVYRSYLAGVKESRMASTLDHDDDYGWMWDLTLGGRVGLFRFGTDDPVRPEGLQFDLEGAAMPRLTLDNDRDLMAVDFRGGFPLSYGIGPWSTKFAYYHLSSHVGDEFQMKNPAFQRLNYSRDAMVLAQSLYLTDAVRLYAEAEWAFYSDVGEPWAFQAGVDYSPLCPVGLRGAPFAALNAHLREEVDFSGNVVAQAGWQWRPKHGGQLFRLGMQYYNGKSNQYEFYNRNENKFGIGMWYDY